MCLCLQILVHWRSLKSVVWEKGVSNDGQRGGPQWSDFLARTALANSKETTLPTEQNGLIGFYFSRIWAKRHRLCHWWLACSQAGYRAWQGEPAWQEGEGRRRGWEHQLALQLLFFPGPPTAVVAFSWWLLPSHKLPLPGSVARDPWLWLWSKPLDSLTFPALSTWSTKGISRNTSSSWSQGTFILAFPVVTVQALVHSRSSMADEQTVWLSQATSFFL